MTAARTLLFKAFSQKIMVWCLAITCAVGLPLTWQWLQWPSNLGIWGGVDLDWVNVPWILVVLIWAGLAWLHRSVLAYKKSVAHAMYSAAYRALPDAAGITSLKDGRFIDVNPAFCNLLKLRYEDVIGRTNSELQVYATPHERTKLLEELSLHGQVHQLRVVSQSHGELIPGTISAIPIQIEDEECMIFVFHDMREFDKAVHELHIANRQLEQAGQLAKLGAWEDRRGEGLVYWSDVCYDIHGLPRGAPLPSNYLNTFVVPEHRERMRSQFHQCLKARTAWELEIQIIRTDGSKLWVRTRGEAVLDNDGKITAMRGVMQDIDAHKRQEESTRERETLLAVTLEAAALGQWDWDLQTGTITGDAFWNTLTHAKQLIPDDKVCSNSHSKHWTELMSSQDVPRCSNELTRHIQNPEDGPFDITWRMHQPDGKVRWLRSIGKAISFDSHGQANRMLGVCLDVTTQQEQSRNLQQLAHFDPLTGLANRVELASRLDEALITARQNVQLLAVVYLDLDGFKPINDRLGHAAGDRLLVLVAKRLKNALRSTDCISRFGGDEFVLLLTQLNSREECEALLARLMRSISRPYSLDKEFVQVTASMGYTLYPEDDSDADGLVRYADQAMYQAKQLGRNRVQAFDSTLARNKRVQYAHNMSIQDALDRNEFVLYVQPKIDIRSRRMIGVETLARWNHPEKGVLSPQYFLPQMESKELEISFGEWAIQNALRTIERLMAMGLEINVAVNISARHLQQPHFAQWMTEQLQQHPNIPPQLLDLEITESAALYDLSHVAQMLHDLRALKLSVSLDDFGTGYSSLTYLRRLPLDSIKIDRSFVRDMLTDQGDMAIVHGVVSLARSFGYQVIAEGVESEEQSACLERMGCYLAQGYFFAQPMPLEQLPHWLEQWQKNYPRAALMQA